MALCTVRQRACLPRGIRRRVLAIFERPYNCARTPHGVHVRFDNEKISVNKENDSKRDKQHDVRYVRVAGSGHPTRPWPTVDTDAAITAIRSAGRATHRRTSRSRPRSGLLFVRTPDLFTVRRRKQQQQQQPRYRIRMRVLPMWIAPYTYATTTTRYRPVKFGRRTSSERGRYSSENGGFSHK